MLFLKDAIMLSRGQIHVMQGGRFYLFLLKNLIFHSFLFENT